MKELKEKALVTNKVNNLSDLISNLLWIEDKFGDVRVGSVMNLNPSIRISYFENGGKPTLIID